MVVQLFNEADADAPAILWVREHWRILWHKASGLGGHRVICGAYILGAPLVSRTTDLTADGQLWEPAAAQQCPDCLENADA